MVADRCDPGAGVEPFVAQDDSGVVLVVEVGIPSGIELRGLTRPPGVSSAAVVGMARVGDPVSVTFVGDDIWSRVNTEAPGFKCSQLHALVGLNAEPPPLTFGMFG